jgi:hypothetical protein
MFRNVISTSLVMLASLTAPYVMAADACQPVYNSMTKILTTPSHSYSIQTAPLVNGQQRKVETIYVQGKTYMLASGKWMVSPVTPSDVFAGGMFKGFQSERPQSEQTKPAKCRCSISR